MEDYQRKHITENLTRLIDLTTCGVFLRNKLKEKGILGDEDVQELSLDTLIPSRISEILYNKLLQKNNKNTFTVLIPALKKNCDSGAVYILEDELQEKLARNPAKKPKTQKYISPPVGLEEFLQSKISLVLVICTTHIDITIEKVQDLKLEGLGQVLIDEKVAVRRLKTDSPLVLPVKTSNTANFLKGVGTTSKKIVIITEERKDGVEEALRNLPDLEWSKCTQVEKDEIQWSDLSPQFAQEIMGRITLFQNTPFQLETLLTFLGNGNDDNNRATRLKGKFLASMISDESPPFFKNTVPPSFQYYISRRILSREKISRDIFKKELPDIFLFTGFTGIHDDKLTEFVRLNENKKGRTDTSSSQIKQKTLNVRYIDLLSKNHFEDICKLTKAPVHWLHYENEELTWVRSSGSMKSLHELVDGKEKQSCFSEEEFAAQLYSEKLVNRSKMPVCISDTPGMGKSVVLANIGRHMSKKEGTLIIFAVLSEFVNQVKSEHDINPALEEVLINVLGNYLCEQDNELGITLFQDGLKKGTFGVELLLDGYDEVNVQDLNLARKCLRCIIEKLISVRVIVTTRPHLLLSLENTLQTVGFNLEAFSKPDQANFLTKWWKFEHPSKRLIHEKLETFSKYCLGITETTISDKDKDIAGTPLLCLLIAQVYKKSAVSYSDPCEYTGDMDLAPEVMDITSIMDLFEHVVKILLIEYKTRYNLESINEDEMINAHVRESLRLLFPTNSIFPPEGADVSQYSTVTLLKVGILEKSSTELVPRFIHRSFAEYFVSLFAVNNLLERNNEDHRRATKFVFSSVLATTEVELPYIDEFEETHDIYLFASTFTFQLTVYFINAQLNDISPSNFSDVSQQMRGSERCDVALACVYDDHVHLFRHLLQSKFFELDNHFLSSRNFLVITSFRSSVAMLVLLLEDESAHFRSQLIVSPGTFLVSDPLIMLHIAVIRGVYCVFDYLCSYKQFEEAVQEAHKSQVYLLHATIQETWETSSQPNGMTKQRLKIVHLLLKTNPHLIQQTDSLGLLAVCCNKVHLSLLLELIKPEYEANLIQPYNNAGKTVLNNVATFLTAEQFHEFVQNIPQATLKLLLELKDYNDMKSLLCNLDYLFPLKQTFELFSQCGINLSDPSFLEAAIDNGMNSEYIRTLIEFGFSRSEVGDYSRMTFFFPPMHITLQRSFNQISSSLKRDADINAVNSSNRTPILELLSSDSWTPTPSALLPLLTPNDAVISKQTATLILKKVVCCLHKDAGQHEFEHLANKCLEKGGELTERDVKQRTLLHHAAENLCLRGVQFLLSHGLKANVPDSGGNTPLHLAVLNFSDYTARFQVAETLVNADGSIVNACDGNGKTPLSALVHDADGPENFDSKLVELLQCPPETATEIMEIVSNWIEYFDEELALTLIERGAELQRKDYSGATWLHLTMAADLIADIDAVKFFVDQGIPPDVRDDLGNTPLHYSIQSLENDFENRHRFPVSRRNDVKVVSDVDRLRFLVQRGADINAANNAGESVFHLVVRSGWASAVEYLISMGCDMNHIGGSDGGTALHYCFMGDWNARQFRVAELLLRNQGNVNAINASGNSVADLAIRAYQNTDNGRVDDHDLVFLNVLKLFIDYDLDLSRTNREGSPILHLLPSFLPPSQLHQVVEHLVSKEKIEALLQLDGANENIVQAARKHVDLLDETVSLLKSCGLDI